MSVAPAKPANHSSVSGDFFISSLSSFDLSLGVSLSSESPLSLSSFSLRRISSTSAFLNLSACLLPNITLFVSETAISRIVLMKFLRPSGSLSKAR